MWDSDGCQLVSLIAPTGAGKKKNILAQPSLVIVFAVVAVAVVVAVVAVAIGFANSCFCTTGNNIGQVQCACNHLTNFTSTLNDNVVIPPVKKGESLPSHTSL